MRTTRGLERIKAMDKKDFDEERQQYNNSYRLAKKRWDSIAKPIDGLGLLEEYVCKLCAIAGDSRPYKLDKRALVVMCADHGVVARGVTQTKSEVTRVVADNFAAGCSSVNYMAAIAGADVFTVDIGMLGADYLETKIVQGKVINRKIAQGTNDLAIEPAMTMKQCERAIAVGREIVSALKKQGYKIIATGEMGIGNTTPSAVLASLLLGQPAEAVTGRGAGLSESGLSVKRQVVFQAASRVRSKGLTEPLQLLAEVGGFEIAGMVGMYLAAVEEKIPIVIDGAISAVAALVAAKTDDRVLMYAFASHISKEPIGAMLQKELGLDALICGRLCLGEGSGAVMLLPLLDMGLSVYRNMGTFDALHIEAYSRLGKPIVSGDV